MLGDVPGVGADDRQPQRVEPLIGVFQVLHQVPHDDRNELADIDVLAADQPQQPRGVQQGLLGANHELSAGAQGTDHVAAKDIEPEAGHLQVRADFRFQSIGILPAVVGVDQVAVRDHDALGAAGRARGIEDVGQVFGRPVNTRVPRRRRPALPGLSAPMLPAADHGYMVPASRTSSVRGSRAERCRQGGRGQHQRHMGVLEHVFQAFFGVAGIGGIERHVGPARLEHSHDRRQEQRRTLQADSHPGLGSHALPLQEPRELIGPLVQLRDMSSARSSRTTAGASGVCSAREANNSWMQAPRG